jgi:hypothetical protein
VVDRIIPGLTNIWDRIPNLHLPAKSKLKLEHASDADALAAASLRLVQRRVGACEPSGTAFARMPGGHPDRQRDPLDDLWMITTSGRFARRSHRRVAIPAV